MGRCPSSTSNVHDHAARRRVALARRHVMPLPGKTPAAKPAYNDSTAKHAGMASRSGVAGGPAQ
ncbi:hypothetical protein SAMN05428966_110282 [Massilia sp. PDC64]|nr:hypothetical protein SAMN05428966_110282 [Massilia sp. PDC64]